MSLIKNEEITIRVSSVLNKDIKQYGKQYLIDDREDTCWSSDQGSNQWIKYEFKRDIRLKQVNIQFQGGFSSNKVIIKFGNTSENLLSEHILTCSDTNNLQIFDNISAPHVNSIIFLFTECSDFFGRIIVYKLQLFHYN